MRVRMWLLDYFTSNQLLYTLHKEPALASRYPSKRMNPNTHAHCTCPCMLAAGCAARRQPEVCEQRFRHINRYAAASCGACVVSPCLFNRCDIVSSPHGTRALHLPLRACTDLQNPWDAEANATRAIRLDADNDRGR
eukprot:365407-Chlamydomonas_euryale.AAC.3